jgi:hypothetical protein
MAVDRRTKEAVETTQEREVRILASRSSKLTRALVDL